MNMTIVAFCSSPRRKGNSLILADCILKGAQEAGASVEKVSLHGLSIHPCTACGACQKSVETPCAISDDMKPLLGKIRAADALVLASPVSFAAVNCHGEEDFPANRMRRVPTISRRASTPLPITG